MKPNELTPADLKAVDSRVHDEFDLQPVLTGLKQARNRWRDANHRTSDPGGRELPSREALASILDGLRGALFPMRLGPVDLRVEAEDYYIGHTLSTVLHSLRAQVRLELRYRTRLNARDDAAVEQQATNLVRTLAARLPALREQLDIDVLAAYHGDPAAGSVDEVLLCYPGVHAVIHHRIAHELYRLQLPLLARIVAEHSHAQTGIDIHPGATIGSGFFIDHGTGVVIGETTIIGDRVRLYQAVTLGAKRFEADAQGHLRKGLPRHPILEDDVVVYAGATILGRVTIGKGSVIGGNVWVTRNVPPGSNVTQASMQQDCGGTPAAPAA